MKAVVFTLGCKVNECESNSLIEGLSRRGFEVSDKLEKADLYIVNTCAVTHEAEKKSRQMASRIKKLNSNAKIIFTGCATQKDPKAFSNKDGGYLVTGVFGKDKLLDIIDRSGETLFESTTEFEEMCLVKSLRTRTFIKVQDGCNNFCSYCIIPYLRGRSRSRSPESVAEEIKALSPFEAVINGINLSSYNYNGQNLTGLLKHLEFADCRLRLGSLEVNVINREFLEQTKRLKNFAPHFHLSLQSGSDSTLKKMNRHYTASEFLQKVELIREYYPEAGITTDVIVGFPTETDENFKQTLDLIGKVRFSDIHAFAFSPRSGTVAYKMKDLDYQTKKQRLDKLLDVKDKSKAEFVDNCINKVKEFLPEEEKDGYAVGYTENYLRVYVKGALQKRMMKVLIKSAFRDGALGEIIN